LCPYIVSFHEYSDVLAENHNFTTPALLVLLDGISQRASVRNIRVPTLQKETT